MSEHTPNIVSSGEMEQIAYNLQCRMGDFLQVDWINDPVLSQAVHDSRNGGWGVIHGVEGTFNGDSQIESERKIIDSYFSTLPYNATMQTGHAVRNTVATAGRTVEDDTFNDPDGIIRNELIAARAAFTVDTPATDTNGPRRTLWLAMADSIGPLPLWRRVSGPADYMAPNETVTLSCDHIIEPNLGNWRVQVNT
jgi:hypothetical protein